MQLGPLGSDSDAMFEVVEISDACFVHLLMQYAPHTVVNRILNLPNLEATVAANWILAFLIQGTPWQCEHFDDVKLASALRNVVQDSDGTFWK